MRTIRTITLAAAAATAVLLSACSSSSTSPATSGGTAGSAAGDITVNLWNSATGAQADALKTLVDQFNGANQGKINLVATFQGAYAAAQVKYTAAIQSNSTPSIMMMNDVSTQFMLDSKQTVPLHTFTKADSTFDPGTIPAPIKAYYSDSNGLLSMPFNSSQPVLYVNPDLVKQAGLDPTKPPTTWADVVGWADQIHTKTSAYGFGMGLTDTWMIEELTASAGLPWCTSSNGHGAGPATAVKLTDPTQISFLTDLQKMYTGGVALNIGSNSAALASSFSAGKVGLMLNSSGTYGSIKPNAKFTTVISSFPKVTTSPDAGAVIGGASLWIDGPGHNTAEQQASYQVEKFLQSAASQAAWSKATGYLSTNTGSAALPAGKAQLADPAYAAMYKQLAATPTSNAAGGCRMGPFSQVRAAVTSDIDKLLSGKGDVQSLMSNSEQSAAKIMSDYASRVK